MSDRPTRNRKATGQLVDDIAGAFRRFRGFLGLLILLGYVVSILLAILEGISTTTPVLQLIGFAGLAASLAAAGYFAGRLIRNRKESFDGAEQEGSGEASGPPS